jgi:hypothetical protein
MDRRDFMKRMVFLTTLASTSHIRAGSLHQILLAVEPGTGSSIDAAAVPAAVKPISGYLPRFTPATGSALDYSSYRLTYEIVHWGGVDPKTGKSTNNVPGSLKIERSKRDGDVHYGVIQQTRFGGLGNIIEAQITCAADDLNTLKSWRIRTYSRNASGEKVPLSEMDETGENRGGEILIKGAEHHYNFVASHPVLSRWTLIDFLLRHTAKAASLTFDFLQDLSLFKPNQELNFDGTVEVTVENEHKVRLNSYVQTGQGVLPVHYLLDEQNRPQLITSSIVSWALKEIS